MQQSLVQKLSYVVVKHMSFSSCVYFCLDCTGGSIWNRIMKRLNKRGFFCVVQCGFSFLETIIRERKEQHM